MLKQLCKVFCKRQQCTAVTAVLGGGDWRVKAVCWKSIKEDQHVNWRHVPTDQNPADIASRSGIVDEESRLSWHGLHWLSDPRKWPKDIVTVQSVELKKEAKVVKQIVNVAAEHRKDELDDLS